MNKLVLFVLLLCSPVVAELVYVKCCNPPMVVPRLVSCMSGPGVEAGVYFLARCTYIFIKEDGDKLWRYACDPDTISEPGYSRGVTQSYCDEWLSPRIAEGDMTCRGFMRSSWCGDAFDYDADGDVDLFDFAEFQNEVG